MHLETVEYQTCIDRGIEPVRLTVLASGPAANGKWRVDLYHRSAGYQCAGSMARIHSGEHGVRISFPHRGTTQAIHHAKKSLDDAITDYNARVDKYSRVYFDCLYLCWLATGDPCEPQV